jgi:restriction system protein
LASGSRSQWERQQAAIRRELDRQARERARLAKEREKALHQQYLESQQEKAAARTSAVNGRIGILDQALTGILGLRPLSLEQMKVSPQLPEFDPGSRGTADPTPDWTSYAPPVPGGVSRMFGGARRHERRVAEARSRLDAAASDHRQREADRVRELAEAKAEHERTVAGIEAQAKAHNAEIEARRAMLAAGDAEAVEWFVRRVLDNSGYPAGFLPRRLQASDNLQTGRPGPTQ